MWVSHIQMSPTKNHSTFMKMLRQPGCDSRHFTFVPNGQMASIPSFRLCKPKGMPMMVIISISPAMKYSKSLSTLHHLLHRVSLHDVINIAAPPSLAS